MDFIYIMLFLAVQLSRQNLIQFNERNRIYKGTPATPNSIPYQIGLFTKSNKYVISFCGGSLITHKFVLTAAHCLLNISSIKVYLGGHSIRKMESGLVIIDSKKCIVHEKYNPVTFDNDIGLVQLSKSVKLSKRIAIIKLPRKFDDKISFKNKYGILAGWGCTSDTTETISNVLMELRVRLVKNKKCTGLHPSSKNICGFGEFNGSACVGDSGSPLVLENTHKQIGLVSYGSEEGCTTGKPHVYTKIWPYLDWIQRNSDYKIVQ